MMFFILFIAVSLTLAITYFLTYGMSHILKKYHYKATSTLYYLLSFTIILTLGTLIGLVSYQLFL